LRPAVHYHNIPAVKALLRRGADPGAHLATAICRRDMEALKLLLEAGGNTTKACVTAGFNSDLEATTLCLEYGANPRPALKFENDLNITHRGHEPMNEEVRKLLEQFK
jgi:ankyrin repeat protein